MENESESETEREIESVWESLIARLSKLERVEREIERVTERVAVGMKFISWIFQFVVREEVLIFVEEVLIFEI